MKLALVLIATLFASSLAAARCLPFGLFGGKSTSQKLNDYLVDSVDSLDFARNIEAAKAYLAEIKDDEKLRNLTRNFIELDKINAENLCDGESLATSDSLTFALRRDSYNAFQVPELRKRLNYLVSKAALQQLNFCAPRFIKEYTILVNEQKLKKKFETLGYLPRGLRKGCKDCVSLKDENGWLLAQRGIEIRRGGTAAHTAVDDALKKIISDAGANTFKKIDPKTGKLVKDRELVAKIVHYKLYQPCRDFVETDEAKILKKLLTVLRVGNIATSKLTDFYYDSGTLHPVEWAIRLDTCERLLNSDELDTIMMVYASLLLGFVQ